jgi:hypothetical protein
MTLNKDELNKMEGKIIIEPSYDQAVANELGTAWDNLSYIAKEWLKNSAYIYKTLNIKDGKIIMLFGKDFFAILDFGGFPYDQVSKILKKMGGNRDGIRKNIGGMQILLQSFDEAGFISFANKEYYEAKKSGYLNDQTSEVVATEPKNIAWADAIENLDITIRKISESEVRFSDFNEQLSSFLHELEYDDNRGFTLFYGKYPAYIADSNNTPYKNSLQQKKFSEYKDKGALTHIKSSIETRWALTDYDVYAWDSITDDIQKLDFQYPFEFDEKAEVVKEIPVSYIDPDTGDKVVFQEGNKHKYLNDESRLILKLAKKIYTLTIVNLTIQ